MRNDGANCMGCEIRHVSGGRSYLLFANYTQEVRQLQGFKLDLAVFDEQPPDDFFSEIVTRTATTQGQVLCSFTPLKGLNGLVSKFWNREQGL
jgi:phage terminase large subunit-like protein